MSRTKVTRSVLVLVVVGLMCGPAVAGKRKVVVLEVDGPGRVARSVEKAIVELVERRHLLVPRAEYRKAVRMARPAVGADAAHRAATAVRADAVVEGKIVGKGKRRTLVLTVREGRTGEVGEAAYVPVRGKGGRGLDEEGVEVLEEELMQMLAWVEPLPADMTDRVVKGKGKGKGRSRVVVGEARREQETGNGKQETGNRKPGEAEADIETEAETTEAAAEDEAEEKIVFGATVEEEGVRAEGKRVEVEGRVGVAVVGRRLTFAVQDGVAEEMRPRAYDGSPVGGAVVGGEVYPLLRRGGHLARVGVGLRFERAIGVTSRARVDGMAQEFATTQQRWDLGVRYRLPVGRARAVVGAGFQRVSHDIDAGDVALGLPDVDYRCLDVGAEVRAPVRGRWSVGAGGRYLRVLGAGEIMSADSYGGGTAQGVALDASVTYRLRERLSVRAGLDYLRLALAFDGSGAMTEVDGDADKDVGGAADTWTGVHVLLGVDL